jgi:antirestriction protein ArdC
VQQNNQSGHIPGFEYSVTASFLFRCSPIPNFAAPIWMTFKQALELDAHIRKGEKGSLVVYADSGKPNTDVASRKYEMTPASLQKS